MANLGHKRWAVGAQEMNSPRTAGVVGDGDSSLLSRREAIKRIAGLVGGVVVAGGSLSACAPAATPAPQPTAQAAAPTQPPEATTAPTTAPTVAATAAAATATAAATEAPTTAATTAATTGATPASAPAGVTVPADDPAVQAGFVEFPGQDATIRAYQARPAGEGPFPGVLICHENRGLTPHFEELPRRFAKAGYVALAVDVLSGEGGTDKVADQAQVPTLLSGMPPEQIVQYFRDGLTYLQEQTFVASDRIGMTGFCFGGGVTWRCATQIPELKAAVPFYGPNPPLEDVPKIQAAVLAIYGEADTRITSGAAAIEEAMKQNNKIFEKIIYPNAQHAFFNDTGTRYDPAAAADAWAKMLAWFGKYLI